MKTLRAFATCLPFLFAGQAKAAAGLEIMKEQQKRMESQTEYSRLVMTLIDKRGNKKNRVMHIWSSKKDDGLYRFLLKFSSPGDIRNVGLLTWEREGEKEDDQWLSLPATKRVKRITGGSKKNIFMGTDFSYEDLRVEDLFVHSYKILKEEVLDGSACWMIEAVPSTAKEKKESGYSKRVIWIRKDNYLRVKTEFYGRGGKLEKRGFYDMPVKVKGQLWRNRRTTMTRLARGSSTVTQMSKLQVDEDIDTTLLTQQGLKRPVVDR